MTLVVNNEKRILCQQMFGSPSTPILENPEYQTRWYFKYFLGKRKLNTFVGFYPKHFRSVSRP